MHMAGDFTSDAGVSVKTPCRGGVRSRRALQESLTLLWDHSTTSAQHRRSEHQ